MKASKVFPSGRILTKWGICVTAWSIGKSLYNETRELVLGKVELKVEWSTNDSSSEPSSLHSASDDLDHIRSRRICWI